MHMFIGLAQLLVPLLVVGGIVGAALAAGRHEGLEADDAQDEGIGRLKRLYFYPATLVSMLIAGIGVVLVVEYLLDATFGPAFLSPGTARLSVGVALAVIWAPIWTWHRMKVQHFVVEVPTERRSLLRKMYVYGTLIVTIALVAQASVELLRWLVGAKPFGGYAPAALIVWGALWAFHWVAEDAEGQSTDETRAIRRLYIYATSAFSLVMLAAGGGFVLYLTFREAYDAQFPVHILIRDGGLWSDAMGNSLSVAIVGAALWSYHWLRLGAGDRGSSIRQVYLHFFATLAGAITTLSTAGIILFGVLQWFIGTPDESVAAAHFRFLPGAVASLVAGSALALPSDGYLAGERQVRKMDGPKRNLLLHHERAGAGSAGLGHHCAGAHNHRTDDHGLDGLHRRERLVARPNGPCRHPGTAGVPLWTYHWFSVQRVATAAGATGRLGVDRKLLTYGSVVIGSLGFLGAMSNLLYLLINALMKDSFSSMLLVDGRWSIATVVAAGLIVPYYWSSFARTDGWFCHRRRSGPAGRRRSRCWCRMAAMLSRED